MFALHLSATQLQPHLLFGKSRWQLPFVSVGCAAKILFGGWLIPFALLAWKFGLPSKTLPPFAQVHRLGSNSPTTPLLPVQRTFLGNKYLGSVSLHLLVASVVLIHPLKMY